MKTKSKGTPAATWFAGQSFHATPVTRIHPERTAEESPATEAAPPLPAHDSTACNICLVFGERCCKVNQGLGPIKQRGLADHQRPIRLDRGGDDR